MRILFIGGTRFFGRRAVEMLAADGHQVVVLSRRAPAVQGTAHVAGQREDAATLDRAFAQGAFDAVVDNIAYEPERVEEVLARLRGAETHYVLTSSYVVYGAEVEARGIMREPDADLGLVDESPYANGKRRCEAVLVARGEAARWTILRPCNVDGPEDPSPRRGFWLDRLLDGEGALVPSDMDAPSPITSADDVARAIVLAVTARPDENGIYNVASATLSPSAYIAEVARAAQIPAPFVARLPYTQIARRLGGVYRAPPIIPGGELDIGAIRRDLGFVPSAPGDWLPATIAWWRGTGLRSFGWNAQRSAEIALLRELRPKGT